MKNKIFSFIIGVLVGAIVATACYYFYAKYNITIQMKIKRYIFLVAALLLMGQGASAWSGSGNSASDPILIANANDWNTLATNVASGTNYSGKYFKLTADITVTTIVGSYSGTKTFNGTFDGGGHTLTFNYTATAEDTAPFAYL